MIVWTQYSTPVGELTVVAERHDEPTADTGTATAPVTVVAAGFCTSAVLLARLIESDTELSPSALGSRCDRSALGSVHTATEAYLAGDTAALERVPVRQAGTDLQQQFWRQLRAIPAGETRTYRDLAEAAGRPRAIRAAGTACGRNLIAPYVPCHRVKRSDGTLGGYYYGLEAKSWLLDHEKRNR